MIRGSYIAKIAIDFDVDETSHKRMMPFEQMKFFVEDGLLDRQIEAILTGPIAMPDAGIIVTVRREFAEIWKEDE